MNTSKTTRISKLTGIFLREQLREPISLLWTLISPSALFYFITHSNAGTENYIQATTGFYAYIACAVAFFGVAFYIIGRRESGFIRSFIYTTEAKAIFLLSHLSCYFVAAIVYCVSFYMITKPGYDAYSLTEFGEIIYKFLICFMIFCSPALYLANRKLKFQSASTTFSILILIMIFLALLESTTKNPFLGLVNSLNPFLIAKNIMAGTSKPEPYAIISSLILAATIALTSANLKINPVWSRY